MKKLVCQTQSSGTGSLSWVTDCLEKLSPPIEISKQRVWKNQISATESPDKSTVCLGKNSEQMTDKQNSVKICIRYLKKHLPYMEIDVALTKKG